MSEILINWLNNEIELSQTVQNVEDDFSNGYLFGELLYKFNQQSNFKEFSRKNQVNDKLDNFKKLEQTFRNLNLKFTAKDLNSIMHGERGVALRMLYQLKMQLEKVYPPTDIGVLRKSTLFSYKKFILGGKTGDNQPALKIAQPKEKYDEQRHQFTSTILQSLNKPQKQLNMERHLSKFEVEKQRQEEDARKFRLAQLEAKEKAKQDMRKASINKIERQAGFMEQWMAKGVEDWNKNQTIKKERERRQLEFEYKQAEKFKHLTFKKIDSANAEVHVGIDQFEQTLKSIGINTRVRKEDADFAVTESLQNSPLKQSGLNQLGFKSSRFSSSIPPRQTLAPLGGTQALGQLTTKTGGITLTSTGLKAKEKKTITEKTRKERERRRRKMIVDQSRTHSEMEQKQRESQIVERMRRQAKQENELQYEQWRTNQCKNVIVENRKLREARYEKRRELDQQTANWREEEMLKQLEEQMNRELNILRVRDDEMRIMHKQFKRENKTEVGSNLFDQIFDIANQAYIHQQLCDSQEIDQRNWHEWLQQFIEGLPIEPDKEIVDEEANQTDEIQEKLDHLELVDYLKNKGQWPETLITQYKVNLEQIYSGQSDIPTGQPAAGAKGNAKQPAKAQAEAIQLEEGDTEVPPQAPNNYLLGDAVETIININFDEREKQKMPIIPHHLSLKLCLIGYQFAGKKTQAEKLKNEYGLQIIQMSDLVQESLQYATQEPFRGESIKYMQSQQQIDINQFQVKESSRTAGVESEFDFNPEEDFRQCGIKIQDLLIEGQEITDDLYVSLFVAKLRMTFSYKSQAELEQQLQDKVKQEIDLERQIRELEEELQEIQNGYAKNKRSEQQVQKDLEKLQQELHNVKQVEKNGWILVDFPTNFAQAKLLETALSGYIPNAESDPVNREIEQSEANLLVQPTDKEMPPQQLIKSGLDAVIMFDCDKDTCMVRAIGRRFDPEIDKMYHIINQPPLTTNAPLCERLAPMDEEHNSEATLIDRWISFDTHRRSLENWLVQFGDAELERSIMQRIDASVGEEQVYLQIGDIVNSILEIKKYREEQEKQKIKDEILRVEEEERLQAEQARLEEEERLKMEQEGEQKEEVKKEQEKPKVTKPEGPVERVPQKVPSIENIDNDIKGTLHSNWKQMSTNYRQQMKKTFRQIREQRERIISKFSNLQNSFLKFLHRPDTKQEKLDNFIRNFNEFSDQYPDLREDDQTKEELHQRVDILADELWDLTEERKEQHIEERKKLMESGTIEYELAFMISCAQQLMQSEVDRFKGSIQLIHDYYHLFEDKLIPEAPPILTNDLVNEGEELPPVEISPPEGQDQQNIDLYNYPRLDKIFERALRSQVVPDVTIQATNPNDKKGAAQQKKDPKKPVVEEEKQQEESQYVKDMKRAIKVEKSLLRFRLIQIRNWALKRLKDMRQKALKVYTKLDDWIHVAHKTENDAIDEMSVIIKKAIEEEKKVQDELRIKFMDFCVDEKIMNYIVPPPEKLPAMEEIRSDRFTIAQLKNLVDELLRIAQEVGNGTTQVPNKIIVDLFVRKLENAKTFGDDNSLPEEWKQDFSEYHFQTLVRNLDKYNQGQVNYKLLATCLCLLKSPIPTEKEAESYQQELQAVAGKEANLDEEKFASVAAWFDKIEFSNDRDYSIHFPRVKYIKELIFKINREEKGGCMKINIKKLITLLKAKEMTMFKKNIRTYYDILFHNIEK